MVTPASENKGKSPQRSPGGDTRSAPDRGELRVGVSQCLLGDNVRYDGGHKRNAFVAATLESYVTFVPVCPEMEVGMGVPRETLRLVDDSGSVRMVTGKSGVDHTDAMEAYAAARVTQLQREDLSGFILKRGSPSCGMERVKVYRKGMPTTSSSGLFARELLRRSPNLPIEEEGRLSDARLRENFVERIFAYRRLRVLFSGRWRIGELVAFHAREKLLLMSHSPAEYRVLGQMVADAKKRDRVELSREYETLFMRAMKKNATTRKHTNVLQHVAGYFKKLVGPADKAEVQAVIGDFHAGIVPLVVPLTLLRHYVRLHAIEYLAAQTYLEPHPKELMLRNHV